MRIDLIAVGTRPPTWVTAGFNDYAARLPRECALHLIEIPTAKRGPRADLNRVLRAEGERMLAAIPTSARVIALEIGGQSWSTAQLAQQLAHRLQDGRDVALLIGGPDGLDDACHRRADSGWSLSPLTFPHALVRILVAEQLYRAWSLLHQHPYHRA